MAGVQHASLNVSITVSVAQLSLHKTVDLNGFSSVESFSRALTSLAQCCGNLRFEHGLDCFNLADVVQQENGSECEKKGSDFYDIWEAVLLQSQEQCLPQKRDSERKPTVFSTSWQDRLLSAERELANLRSRFARNLESIARMRSTYLLEIVRLKEFIFTKYGQCAIPESKDAVLPNLRFLSAEDYITPADLSLPLQQAIACTKARMEIEWNEYAQQLQKRIEALCQSLHQKTEQAAKQAEFYDRLWCARRGKNMRDRTPHKYKWQTWDPSNELPFAPTKSRARFDSDHTSGSAASPQQTLQSSGTSPAKFLKSVWRRTFSPNCAQTPVQRAMTAPEIIIDGHGKLSIPKFPYSSTPLSPTAASSDESAGNAAAETSNLLSPLPSLGRRPGPQPSPVLLGSLSSNGDTCKAPKSGAVYSSEPGTPTSPTSCSERLQELRPPPICTTGMRAPHSGSLKCPGQDMLDATTDVVLDDSLGSADVSPASTISAAENADGKLTRTASDDSSAASGNAYQGVLRNQKGGCSVIVEVETTEHGLQPPSPGSIPYGVVFGTPSRALNSAEAERSRERHRTCSGSDVLGQKKSKRNIRLN